MSAARLQPFPGPPALPGGGPGPLLRPRAHHPQAGQPHPRPPLPHALRPLGGGQVLADAGRGHPPAQGAARLPHGPRRGVAAERRAPGVAGPGDVRGPELGPVPEGLPPARAARRGAPAGGAAFGAAGAHLPGSARAAPPARAGPGAGWTSCSRDWRRSRASPSGGCSWCWRCARTTWGASGTGRAATGPAGAGFRLGLLTVREMAGVACRLAAAGEPAQQWTEKEMRS